MFTIDELREATGARVLQGGGGGSMKGVSIDSRTILPRQVFIAIKGDNFDGHDFIDAAIKQGAGCIIKQKGNPVPEKIRRQSSRTAILEVDNTVKALGDIACFHRKRFSIPVIAVTGSNGKTTTKEMISWVLSERYSVLKNEGTQNNHIGLPLALLKLTSRHEIAVLEVGTNHFGEVANLANICRASIGVITNIGPTHLEHFHDLAGVAEEKYSLIKHLECPALAVLNADDAALYQKIIAPGEDVLSVGFGVSASSDFTASAVSYAGGKLRFCMRHPRATSSAAPARRKYTFTLNTLGYYNVSNALAAITLGRIFGMGYPDIIARLASFKFPDKRLTLKKFKNITFIDDSYNANPASLKQALDALSHCAARGRKIFVMGDMLELGSGKALYHAKAGEEATRVCDIIVAVGQLSRLAAQAAQRSGFDSKNIFTCDSTCQAKDILFKKISPDKDDVVLIKGSRLMKMEDLFK
ncbi:MAG: UDP-N-acetylmuramoyl-tripeptide--D-alanyl-D-alanine ligase [Candidatus Omnitrophota bacterium]|jgi:UDP-N-acetylmuramoyl-tripeptide--D-alanyl-D-alanine ligase